MLRNCLLFLFIAECCIFSIFWWPVNADQVSWPQPDQLVGFWPFNANSGTTDIAHDNKQFTVVHLPELVTAKPGPFGLVNTSYTVKDNGLMESYIGHQSMTPPNSFTISFYLNTSLKSKGGILTFDYSIIAVAFEPPNVLKIWTNAFGGIFPSHYDFKVLKPNEWQFIAITYDKTRREVAIFNDKGKRIGLQSHVSVFKPTLGAAMYVGWAHWATGFANMQPGDALSCFMVYDTVLTSDEISTLPQVCRQQHSGATPILPTTTQAAVVEETPEAETEPDFPETTLPTTRPRPTVLPWPKGDDLVAFWALDSQYNGKDLSGHGFHGPQRGLPLVNGPFGDRETAVTTNAANEKLFEVVDPKMSIADKSFTLSFFFRKEEGNKEGGILEFLPGKPENAAKTFQVRYVNEATLELSANGVTVGQFQMIQQKGAWTYAAFVYDATDGKLAVYTRHGLFLAPMPKPQLKKGMGFNNNGIRVGYSSRWKMGFQPDDALSCLSLHATVLSAQEIRQLIDACRAVVGSASCGIPRVPLSPIPLISTATVPQPGQFPYVATLVATSTSAICTANVIDEFWLVTSAQCFKESTDPANFMLSIGKLTMALTHSVSKIILSGSTEQDIALVQVTDPIDFSTPLVNDVCLPRDLDTQDLKLSAPFFLVGWGENGRETIVDKTFPRYVVGLPSSERECAKAWGLASRDSWCFMGIPDGKSEKVPCKGDEGSPLLAQANADESRGVGDRLVALGLYYKRDTDCSADKPGLFVNLAVFNPWIDEKLACALPGVAYPDKCPQ